MLGQEGANVAPSALLSEKPPKRVKTLRRRDDLEETRTRRWIEGRLRHFFDLAQALLDDGRSKKWPNITVERQIAFYRAGQAK